jgi:CO dehydrogenase maturation factor
MSRVAAVGGKGGAGKTTVCAVLAAALLRQGRRSLIVDADHAGGLGLALNLRARRTINQVRKRTIGEIQKKESDRRDLAMSIDYLLMEAVTERGPLAFLSIGRPEEAGCYCSVNTLLRGAIELLAKGFELTLIDAEAGVEQVSRKVMSEVDYLLLVSDPSRKGLTVAAEILRAAQDLGVKAETGLLLNRLGSDDELKSISVPEGLQVIGAVPEDETIRRFDREGLSFFDLPDCPAGKAIIQACAAAGVL